MKQDLFMLPPFIGKMGLTVWAPDAPEEAHRHIVKHPRSLFCLSTAGHSSG
jgi:hypothetical protein